MLYTEHLNPRGPHKVDHNLTLAEAAGARITTPRFPLHIRAEDEDRVTQELARHSNTHFYVLNPGGGWRSKCWPAERYGELHRKLSESYGWRAIVSFGPGEENLAQESSAPQVIPAAVAIPLELGPLMALMRRAKFVVSADTGRSISPPRSKLRPSASSALPILRVTAPTATTSVIRNPRSSKRLIAAATSILPPCFRLLSSRLSTLFVKGIRV